MAQPTSFPPKAPPLGISFLLLTLLLLFGLSSQSALAKVPHFSLRMGEGGTQEERSPLGALGGHQLALDVGLSGLPLALSVSGEAYNNGSSVHYYEIAEFLTLNLLYRAEIAEDWILHFGGGRGSLAVPIEDPATPNSEELDAPLQRVQAYNLELGLNWRIFQTLGLYLAVKSLQVQEPDLNVRFDSKILLIGMSLNFGD